MKREFIMARILRRIWEVVVPSHGFSQLADLWGHSNSCISLLFWPAWLGVADIQTRYRSGDSPRLPTILSWGIPNARSFWTTTFRRRLSGSILQ